MQEYKNKQELLDEIEKRYTLFDKEFDDVKEEDRKTLVDGVEKTPQQMISYQIGWVSLVNSWEKDEKDGKTVITPTPDYKWNNLGGLYQSFYDDYDNCTLQELRKIWKQSVDDLCDWINELSEDELFIPNMRKWTVTNANWAMWKWIHINTVAPFKNFRTQIRKWKKNLTTTLQ